MCAAEGLPPMRPLQSSSTVSVSPLTVMSASPVAGDAFGGTSLLPRRVVWIVNDVAYAGVWSINTHAIGASRVKQNRTGQRGMAAPLRETGCKGVQFRYQS